MFKARTRQNPSPRYLGVDARPLKGFRKGFEPFGKFLGTIDDCRIECGGQIDFAPVHDLVGQQQRCKQQLPRFGEGAEAGQRLTALGVDQRARGAKILFLAIAASDSIGAAGAARRQDP
jgi:hypothetical protein